MLYYLSIVYFKPHCFCYFELYFRLHSWQHKSVPPSKLGSYLSYSGIELVTHLACTSRICEDDYCRELIHEEFESSVSIQLDHVFLAMEENEFIDLVLIHISILKLEFLDLASLWFWFHDSDERELELVSVGEDFIDIDVEEINAIEVEEEWGCFQISREVIFA